MTAAGTGGRIQERLRTLLGAEDVLTGAAASPYRLGDRVPGAAVSRPSCSNTTSHPRKASF